MTILFNNSAEHVTLILKSVWRHLMDKKITASESSIFEVVRAISEATERERESIQYLHLLEGLSLPFHPKTQRDIHFISLSIAIKKQMTGTCLRSYRCSMVSRAARKASLSLYDNRHITMIRTKTSNTTELLR